MKNENIKTNKLSDDNYKDRKNRFSSKSLQMHKTNKNRKKKPDPEEDNNDDDFEFVIRRIKIFIEYIDDL
jgi:hypothetical protein